MQCRLVSEPKCKRFTLCDQIQHCALSEEVLCKQEVKKKKASNSAATLFTNLKSLFKGSSLSRLWFALCDFLYIGQCACTPCTFIVKRFGAAASVANVPDEDEKWLDSHFKIKLHSAFGAYLQTRPRTAAACPGWRGTQRAAGPPRAPLWTGHPGRRTGWATPTSAAERRKGSPVCSEIQRGTAVSVGYSRGKKKKTKTHVCCV